MYGLVLGKDESMLVKMTQLCDALLWFLENVLEPTNMGLALQS